MFATLCDIASLWCELPQAILGGAKNCLRQFLAKPRIAQMKKEEKDEFNCQFDLNVRFFAYATLIISLYHQV